MDKLEHLAIMLNRRTNGKKYENFVVNAIYARIGNPELIPITQQYVKNKNYSETNPNKYYLLDLYFPQLRYGIEVDEIHHLSEENQESDKKREEGILTAIQCEEGRIAIFNSDGTPKSYDEVNEQIDYQVEYVKHLIIEVEKRTGRKLHWENSEIVRQRAIEQGYFRVSDDIDYENVTEIYRMCGRDVQALRRGFIKLNESYKLWVPYLAIELEDGTVKTRNGWRNTLNEDHTIISETVGDLEKCDTKDHLDGPWNEGNFLRVVFMHIRDSFGLDKVRFLGVFQSSEVKTENGVQTRFYKRVAEVVKISDLK